MDHGLPLWEEEYSNEELITALEEMVAGEPLVAEPGLLRAAESAAGFDAPVGLDLALIGEDFSTFNLAGIDEDAALHHSPQQQLPHQQLPHHRQASGSSPLFVPITTQTNSSTDTTELPVPVVVTTAPARLGGSSFSMDQQSLLQSLTHDMLMPGTLLGAAISNIPSTSLESNTSRGSAGATRHQRRSVSASPAVVPSTFRNSYSSATLSMSLEFDADDPASVSTRSLPPIIPCSMCEKTFPCHSKVRV